ncbi:MAG TPA: hypothetical protein PKN87_10745 [Syntrophomonadaceae bacterium]|mgnify:CR=1 FL=1|nr:hypothetical protein [Syntrophomonadaceae bacterium]
MTDEEHIEWLKLMDYIHHFNVHYTLLLRRYKRFTEINTLGNNDIEVITYFDMIIVQLRAMCIENERYKNTQSVFHRQGCKLQIL